MVIFFLVVVFGIATYNLATANTQFSSEGLRWSMELYKSDLQIKRAIDRLQMSWHCCGHLSFTNWTDRNIEMKPGPRDSQNQIIRFVPFSCCNSASPRPCVHDRVRISSPFIRYQYPRDLTIYTEGCSVILQASYETLLKVILSITGITLLCEVTVLISVFWIVVQHPPKQKNTSTEDIQTSDKQAIKDSGNVKI
ncbi:unnamed protein product [Allacma fusca]|uniref:Tetraspanin n=1 Tax=Allacma fusca TaxID=39272 RepID=A0A8J2KXG1_9HEXA|nr:unnamed protein product [Allacma fusca]